MRKIYGFLAVFLIAAGGTAWADDITADVLTYDGKAKTVTATGNVEEGRLFMMREKSAR